MSHVTRRIITVLAAAAATLAIGAASASAGISTTSPASDPDTLSVTLSAPPAGATHYTLAQCNVTDGDPADWGRDCDSATDVGFSPVSATSPTIDVNQTFTNHSFVPGLTPQFGSTTTCKGTTGSQCAVVASWYSYTPGAPPVVIPIGTPEKADFTF